MRSSEGKGDRASHGEAVKAVEAAHNRQTGKLLIAGEGGLGSRLSGGGSRQARARVRLSVKRARAPRTDAEDVALLEVLKLDLARRLDPGRLLRTFDEILHAALSGLGWVGCLGCLGTRGDGWRWSRSPRLCWALRCRLRGP
eukprot:65932-Pleurochrysis_carterae.AAC.1